MNRDFNNNGIERTNTRELKDNTFEIKKKAKKGVKVHSNTYRRDMKTNTTTVINPNKGVMSGILGNLGLSGKTKKSTRRTARKTTKKSTLKTKLRTASKKTRAAPVKLAKVKKARKPRGPNKPFDESYLDCHRTQIYKRNRRRRAPVNMDGLFSEDKDIKRTRSSLRAWKQAQRFLTQGTVNVDVAEEADDESMADEVVQNNVIPTDQLTGLPTIQEVIEMDNNGNADNGAMAQDTNVQNDATSNVNTLNMTQNAPASNTNVTTNVNLTQPNNLANVQARNLTQLLDVNQALNMSVKKGLTDKEGLNFLKRTISDIAANVCN
jgi:hypothetical protein